MNSNNEPNKKGQRQDSEERQSQDGPQIPDSKDLTDSKSDQERLKGDTSYIILPDVADIERQNKIEAIDETSDLTSASADEEGMKNGKDLLSEENDDLDIVMGTEADVTEEDLQLLGDPDQDMDMGDDELIRSEGLDDTDLDGDPLNEGKSDVFTTGDDLDMPANDGNDALDNSLETDDEENDYYSLDDDGEIEEE